MKSQTVHTLREAGLRATAPRCAVYEAVAQASNHPDVDAIATAVRHTLGKVSTQAVYDTLAAFEKANLIRVIDPKGSVSARFEIQTHDNHHHLVCRVCQHIVDVPCGTGEAPCLHPQDAHGFAVDEAEVVYWGVCAQCQSGAEHRRQSGVQYQPERQVSATTTEESS